MFKHELGLRATDKISGFTGTITSRVEYLTGCDRYYVQPKASKEGTFVEGAYFDEAQLITDEVVICWEDVQGEKKGACSPDPCK